MGVATMTTAYSKPFDELVDQARQYARELGAIPSQNKLKAALHVRSERARTVLAVLRASGFDPAEPQQSSRARPVPDEPGGAPVTPDSADSTLSGTVPWESLMDQPEPVPGVEANGTSAPDSTAAGRAMPDQHRALRRSWSGLRSGRLRDREPVPSTGATHPVRTWPIVLLAAPAMVAIWSGWVGLGVLTGFGMVHPLPGIADGFTLNSAITLPVGVETYAAYALRVWLATGTGADQRARSFAKWSAIGSLALGAAGQVAYHLMTAQHVTTAPWEITTAVACLPVVVLGFGAALAHLQHHPHTEHTTAGEEDR
jgi:hypothetical protein